MPKWRPSRPGLATLGLAVLLLASPVMAAREGAEEQWTELPLSVSKETLERVYKLPEVQVAPGYASRFLVPTRSPLFDPFDIHVASERELWTADDGATGAVFAITLDGKVETLADTGYHAPYSLDVAPKSFGKHAGKIYAIAFNKPEKAGGWELPMAITRIDPATGTDEVVCFLPPNDAGAPGAGGFFLRFGPAGSPFADRIWITTASNHSLYVITPDQQCKWFKTIDIAKWGSPRGIAFTPDGRSMLLGFVVPEPDNRAATRPGAGHIMLVSADGTIDEKPYVTGLHEPGAFAFAPAGFGPYAGQLFVSDAGDWNNSTEATEPVNNDGRIYRVTPEGKLEVFATGLSNPVGVAFLGTTLVVTDIKGDFHVGQHKIPDGFVVAIEPAR